jgi:hypothetical protein
MLRDMKEENAMDKYLERFSAYIGEQYDFTIDNPIEVVEIIKGLERKELF